MTTYPEAKSELSAQTAEASGRSGAVLYRAGLKRVFDLTIVLTASVFVIPVIGVLALIIALNGGKPFYKQLRVGRGGRIYTMWKLRSMRLDSDSQLESYLVADAEARVEWDSTQKLKNDPRITRFGRLLRKSSLDELPQLWNVFVGDMSLVGPRPILPEQQALYTGKAYYRLRPGITGNWQVSERNQSAFADRAEFDTQYEKTLSFKTDVSLLASTVWVVLRGTGY